MKDDARADRTVTRTGELALEPQVRRFARRRYVGGALGVLVLLVLALAAVRELSSVEELLVAEGTSSARAVVYELPRGAEMRIPIEPRTDVLRFVVHAYRRGAPLLPTPRAAKIAIEANGDRGTRTEELVAAPPGNRTRVTAQEPGLGIGDPIAFDVDVHAIGVGDLVVRVTSIEDADGLLVRAYRREVLSESEALVRGAALDRRRKDVLAQWTWELGWDELTPVERSAVLAMRWHRVGALRSGGRELRSVAVALSPSVHSTRAVRPDTLLGRVALRGDERIAVLARRGATVHAVADAAATLRATLRAETAEPTTQEGRGLLDVTVSDEREPLGVEIGTDRDAVVELRTTTPELVEWLGSTHAWRATASKPVVVESPERARIVRVSARRPMDRRDGGTTTIAARVEISAPSLARPLTQVFRADRARSRFDRYETFDPLEAPSARASFYVAIPAGGVARLAPAVGAALDVTLAELDESAPPEPLAVRPLGAPPAAERLEGEAVDDASRVAAPFVSRRPSNVAELGDAGRVVVRLARHWVPVEAATSFTLAKVKHGGGARIERGGRSYEAIAPAFDVEPSAKRPLVLPLAAFADRPTTLQIEVGHDAPRAGVFAGWTLPRTMAIGPDETRAALVVHDDVAAGRLKLRIVDRDASHARVHFPWAATPSAGPRWISGQFEE